MAVCVCRVFVCGGGFDFPHHQTMTGLEPVCGEGGVDQAGFGVGSASSG